MKNIIYIGNFFFPMGNAAGKRVYANGKILQKLGYNVLFIGQDKQLCCDKCLKSTENLYDGFYHYAYSYPRTNVEWMRYKKAFNLLVEFVEQDLINNLEFIIIYGSPRFSFFNTLLIKYFKRRGVRIIADSVDWLTTKTNNIFFDIVKTFHYSYQNSYINKCSDGVIVISEYLEAYYKNAGIKTVLIPPLSVIDNELILINNENYKTLVYAGLPFRKGQVIRDLNTLKDRIDKTIVLLYKVKEKGGNFVFNIYGFTKDEYLKVIPSQVKYVEGLGKSIQFHGMKLNEEVTKEISKADFTILVRDVNRDTTAGFPTKISESISCGTPVITTKTSDLENYIIDGVHGFYINIDDENEAVKEVINAISSKRENILNMKMNCINSKAFYFEKYIGRLERFIEML